jgi:alkyl sulfatase BDS1-like metallo-beta-lactamase superfamily hydrolase
VVFLGHTWPRGGRENIARFLRLQADAYKYIHDQTLRLANAGYTMTEIAEEIRLPAVLAGAWFNRGYYATVGWTAKAVYQHYLGWYDGNPASFDPLPPVEAASVTSPSGRG